MYKINMRYRFVQIHNKMYLRTLAARCNLCVFIKGGELLKIFDGGVSWIIHFCPWLTFLKSFYLQNKMFQFQFEYKHSGREKCFIHALLPECIEPGVVLAVVCGTETQVYLLEQTVINSSPHRITVLQKFYTF